MTTSKTSIPTRPNRVLAADPGYARLGLAVLERKDGKECLLYSACVETASHLPLSERIALLTEAVALAIKEYAPEALALERIFFNQSRSTAMGVAEVRGMLETLAAQNHIPVFEYAPQQVKIAVTGYGASDKRAVAQMLERLVVLPARKRLDDELDAIAVGVTCLVSTRV